MGLELGVWQEGARGWQVTVPGRKPRRGDGESGAPLNKGCIVLGALHQAARGQIHAFKLPREAADLPGKARRPWVTPAELTALALVPHPRPGVGASLPSARS